MSFFDTARDVRLEDGHMLRASLQRVDGEWQDAEINLNDHIGNDNGRFCWDSNGMSTPLPSIPALP